MIAFLIIGVVGLLLMILSSLLGDVLDGLFDAMPGGLFNGTVVFSFVAAFGFGGMLAMSTFDVGVPVAIGVGTLAGGLIGLGAYAFMRFLQSSEDPSGLTGPSAVVGKHAVVITPALAGNYGEVSMTINGHPEKKSFLCDEDTVRGQQVIVEASLSSTSVKVVNAVTKTTKEIA